MINKLIGRLSDAFIQRVNRVVLLCFQQKNATCSAADENDNAEFDDYRHFVDSNSAMSFDRIEKTKVKQMSCKERYVGGVLYDGILFCIPNSADCVMTYNTKNAAISYFGDVGTESYKWTGGCIYNKKIYGFPRSSNSLLEIVPHKMSVSLVPLNTNYSREHHYAGVVTPDGIMYLPPRDENHILVINLNTFSVERIYLCPPKLKLKFRYQNGILHPNGNIYFFPERDERVLVFNPETRSFHYIGKKLDCYVFEAQICGDGSIYGFSHRKGILRIDIKKQTAKMIHDDVIFGSYGTKHGLNGKLYSIPGKSSIIYEYDALNDKLAKISTISEQGKAKCAGGVTADDGSIIAVPAYGEFLYKYRFCNVKNTLFSKMRDSLFYIDTY